MRKATLLLLALAPLAGCEDILDAAVPCIQGVPSDLQGQWDLRGEGVRTGCADPRLDGEFTISTAVPVIVVQDSAFPDDEAELRLADPIPGFTLHGALSDHCFVAFDVTEETTDGPITYHFTGDPDNVDGPRIERGVLTGEGPGTCKMTGTFGVTIK